jgi:hypothetical protein
VRCIFPFGDGVLAIDDRNLYVGQSRGPSLPAVVRIALDGGAPVTLAQHLARALATDGSYVYWIEFASDAGANTDPAILRVPVEGGAVSTVIRLPPGAQPVCLAVDEANVYWTDNGIVTDSGIQPGVAKVAKTGGAPVVLGFVRTLRVLALTVDSANVYWTAAEWVLGVGKDGGLVDSLADTYNGVFGESSCHGLVIAAGTLYTPFLTGDMPGGVLAISTTEAALNVLAASSVLAADAQASAVAAGSRAVYWTQYQGPDIYETPLDGGPTVALTTPPTNALSDLVIGSDGTLYWTTDSQVQAMKPAE